MGHSLGAGNRNGRMDPVFDMNFSSETKIEQKISKVMKNFLIAILVKIIFGKYIFSEVYNDFKIKIFESIQKK